MKNYGVRVGVRSNDRATLDQLLDYLPPGWQPARGPVVDRIYSVRVGGAGSTANVRRFHLAYENGWRLTRTMDMAMVFDRFESAVQLYVAAAARRRVFVHAGVVGWRGRAIVIPGRSFSGKSALVAALVRAGATYYSDEYAVLDAQGRVHPFHRPLALRDESGEQSERCWPESLGGRRGSRPLPVGLVAVTIYEAGARWRPRAISPGRTVLELLANTVPARERPTDVLAALQRAVTDTLLLKSKRGEAKATAAAILQRLDS